MPFYTYTCKECGKTVDLMRAISERDDIGYCGQPDCHDGILVRDISAELRGQSHINAMMADNERYSWAMGVNVNDIPNMVKQFPGSEYCPETGRLKIKNRQHKLYEMKRRGFAEYN